MKAAIYSLTILASALTAAPLAVTMSAPTSSSRPAMSCEPGTRGCGAQAPGKDETPSVTPDVHPCGWVETCQLPCDGDGRECCHADWECPPDATLPRC